jgi:hypothetical protein
MTRHVTASAIAQSDGTEPRELTAHLARVGQLARGIQLARCAALVASLALASSAWAGPPSILSIFQQKSAAVNEQKLELQAEHGPWMILAMTLAGPEGEAQAIALAQELRKTLTSEVYIHHKEFDRTQTLATRKRERHPNDVSQVNVRYAHAVRERTYAVLVGNFVSTDDPRIADMLQRVKTAHPKALMDTQNATPEDAKNSNDTTWLVSASRMMAWKKASKEEVKRKGPMGAAFVTRNPLLPDEFFQRAIVDDFVAGLNDEIGGEKIAHSLLKCPGRYTVRVASFSGYTATQFGQANKALEERDPSDQLDEAALQAHKLTLALRSKGVEAYEFHDRYGSYVTIGSFDSLGSEGPDGTFNYHPEMLNILQQWCGYRRIKMKNPVTGLVQEVDSANSLDKIPFDIEGKPISVPKLNTSKIYSGSLIGRPRI